MDRAWIYGNEAEVGEGLLKSGVPREEVFPTGKLWNAVPLVLKQNAVPLVLNRTQYL